MSHSTNYASLTPEEQALAKQAYAEFRAWTDSAPKLKPEALFEQGELNSVRLMYLTLWLNKQPNQVELFVNATGWRPLKPAVPPKRAGVKYKVVLIRPGSARFVVPVDFTASNIDATYTPSNGFDSMGLERIKDATNYCGVSIVYHKLMPGALNPQNSKVWGEGLGAYWRYRQFLQAIMEPGKVPDVLPAGLTMSTALEDYVKFGSAVLRYLCQAALRVLFTRFSQPGCTLDPEELFPLDTSVHPDGDAPLICGDEESVNQWIENTTAWWGSVTRRVDAARLSQEVDIDAVRKTIQEGKASVENTPAGAVPSDTHGLDPDPDRVFGWNLLSAHITQDYALSALHELGRHCASVPPAAIIEGLARSKGERTTWVNKYHEWAIPWAHAVEMVKELHIGLNEDVTDVILGTLKSALIWSAMRNTPSDEGRAALETFGIDNPKIEYYNVDLEEFRKSEWTNFIRAFEKVMETVVDLEDKALEDLNAEESPNSGEEEVPSEGPSKVGEYITPRSTDPAERALAAAENANRVPMVGGDWRFRVMEYTKEALEALDQVPHHDRITPEMVRAKIGKAQARAGLQEGEDREERSAPTMGATPAKSSSPFIVSVVSDASEEERRVQARAIQDRIVDRMAESEEAADRAAADTRDTFSQTELGLPPAYGDHRAARRSWILNVLSRGDGVMFHSNTWMAAQVTRWSTPQDHHGVNLEDLSISVHRVDQSQAYPVGISAHVRQVTPDPGYNPGYPTFPPLTGRVSAVIDNHGQSTGKAAQPGSLKLSAGADPKVVSKLLLHLGWTPTAEAREGSSYFHMIPPQSKGPEALYYPKVSKKEVLITNIPFPEGEALAQWANAIHQWYMRNPEYLLPPRHLYGKPTDGYIPYHRIDGMPIWSESPVGFVAIYVPANITRLPSTSFSDGSPEVAGKLQHRPATVTVSILGGAVEWAMRWNFLKKDPTDSMSPPSDALSTVPTQSFSRLQF